ncbi:hypothetical protein [Serratia fonticola]|jgi:hypothetical protein|uniref:hypothetical protein n=1 Tax=Serratia fonticola TaxID=47917 RepID=UPI0014153DE4|nr:hypothetical protein [Serratia fonticola]MBP0997059.1 hypothetical protein [Serratia fonticola]MBP1002727.1 hypothetical protein [Serratia fonticola]MBP1012518.1 hypothetical protein [Serratia fonticola]MBP1018748.1 hypothetical protein [Serratia fonticola]NXZ90393.1 hypothetical protein [Serratia fonticola]
MTFLVVLAVLVMLWLAITALLISGLWIFPPLQPAPGLWFWRFLRGDNGMFGTLRIGAVMVGTVWCFRMAGLSLSLPVQNLLILLLCMTTLVAEFNAGRCVALSPTEEVVFCGALGAAWMGMLALGLYWLL